MSTTMIQEPIRHIAIFDIDGCISDDSERLHAFDGGENQYARYHSGCADDKPMNLSHLRYHVSRGHSIVFITGRPRIWSPQTIKWLEDKAGMDLSNGKVSLLMRPDGDKRPSPELKVDLFRQVPRLQWRNVLAAYDDRADILEAYESKGVLHTVLMGARFPEMDDYGRELGLPTDPKFGDVNGPYLEESSRAGDRVLAALDSMRETYIERTSRYGGRWETMSGLMKVLYPDGVPPEVFHSTQFHLFEMALNKLARFAASDLQHVDSIHDAAVYSTIIESILTGDENVEAE